MFSSSKTIRPACIEPVVTDLYFLRYLQVRSFFDLADK